MSPEEKTPLMQLYIVRHGIAIDREDPKCPPEAERYLTEEGIEKTKQVAKISGAKNTAESEPASRGRARGLFARTRARKRRFVDILLWPRAAR